MANFNFKEISSNGIYITLAKLYFGILLLFICVFGITALQISVLAKFLHHFWGATCNFNG
jgi:hypothetical protein